MTVYKKRFIPSDEEDLKFEIRDNMVDVTYLGLPFETKNPLAWLQTPEAAKVAALIAHIRKCKPSDLVHIEEKDQELKIWFDFRFALCYIGWVYPPFIRWFADKISEIDKRLKQNMTQRKTVEENEEPNGILIAFHRPGDKPC